MTEYRSRLVELTNNLDPPRIITDDGVVQVEIFSSAKQVLYRKGFVNGKETTKITDLTVVGKLPEWLSGEFFTVGPGTFDVKYSRMIEVEGGYESGTTTFSMGHWFDGLPLVNRFVLDGTENKVNYRSRLTSKKYESKIRDHHGILTRHPFSLFKTHTNQTPLSKFLGKKKTNKPELEPCAAGININFPLNMPGEKPKVFCQNHSSQIVELDAYDLTPTRVFSWDELNPLFRGDHASPHSHYDETTGELINFNMEYFPVGTKYNFFTISENNPSGQIICSITAKASYVHSFGVTPKFIVLVIFPFYGKNAGINVKWSDNILDSFMFKPDEPTLFYVISREKKMHVATYKSDDPCFAFHHINSFEDEDDNIFLDVVCYDTADVVYDFALENLREGLDIGLPMAEVRRFVLQDVQRESMKFANNLRETQTDGTQNIFTSIFSKSPVYQQVPSCPNANYVRCTDSTLELPRINPKFKRLRYRYVYGIGVSARAAAKTGEIWDALIKSDLDAKEVVAMWAEESCYPSEPVFVACPGQENDEDDGVLLSIVFDGEKIKSFLVVLNAKTMTELARADLPHIVPISFGHGEFKELQKE